MINPCCDFCVCQLYTFLWSICSGPIRVSPPPTPLYHLSTEKDPGCLGYIGDEILPSDAGDYAFSGSQLNNQHFMESKGPRGPFSRGSFYRRQSAKRDVLDQRRHSRKGA